MCLEFLCSWSHREEDGPEHSRPRTIPTNNHQNYPAEHKNGNYNPYKNEAPSKPRNSEPSINGPDHQAKDQVAAGDAAVNRDMMTKEERQEVSSITSNGGKISNAVHPKPIDHNSEPDVAKNTVLAAPVPHREAVESVPPQNVGYNYPVVDAAT